MAPYENNATPILMDLLVGRFEWIEREFNAKLMECNGMRLSKAQLLFMSHLDDGKDRSTSMSEKLGVTRQAVSLLVKELEAKGIIKQIPDPRKASAKLLKKTDFGTRFVNQAMGLMEAIEKDVARNLGEQQFENMKKALAADWNKPGE